MSDLSIEQAIAEMRDLVRCRCHPAYKDRGLHDPDCNCDDAEAVEVLANALPAVQPDPLCECGMTGPCKWTECKAPILTAHVNETPKSEHEAAVMLTPDAAAIREAADGLRKAADDLDGYVGKGYGDEYLELADRLDPPATKGGA